MHAHECTLKSLVEVEGGERGTAEKRMAFPPHGP